MGVENAKGFDSFGISAMIDQSGLYNHLASLKHEQPEILYRGKVPLIIHRDIAQILSM